MAAPLAADPLQGGAAWALLQWLLGFEGAGHRVDLVDPLPPGRVPPGEGLAGRPEVAWLAACAARAGLAGSTTVLDPGSGATWGLEAAELARRVAAADLLVNVSGVLREPWLLEPARRRLWLDLDPGFNQVWHEQGHQRGLEHHHHLATVGLCVGETGCRVPTLGRSWIPTPPPVALSRWPAAPPSPGAHLTTVGHWRSYGSVEHEGLQLGQRAHTVRSVLALPGATGQAVTLAVAVHPDEGADLAALAAHGWRLVDPARVAPTLDAYQGFLRGSSGELGLPKAGYLATRSGWFSDRSAAYLATGRPVVHLDTGFSRHLPVGEGLLAADDLDGLVEAVLEVRRRPERHAAAARALAEQHLDARRVVTDLVERIG